LIRLNPDFVATDGGNTTFFGQQLNDGDNFPNFFGTSAAAPHAAGVAALLTQMSGSKADQNLIVNCMAKTAIDMDDPFTAKFDKGYDFATGFGLIQAAAAAGALLKNIGIKPISVASLCSQKPDSFRNWTISNPNAFNITINYGSLYGGTTQSLIIKPGVNKISTPTQPNRNILLVSWTDAWGNNKSSAAISKGNICNSSKSALADNEEDNDLILFTKAFPNPFTENLNIELFSTNEKEILLNMYDVNGKLVFSKTYRANGYDLIDVNPGQLPHGLYYLKLTTKSGKVIKNIPLMKN
jgi:Secretion system C-terminal sorting domain/Subtilase family